MKVKEAWEDASLEGSWPLPVVMEQQPLEATEDPMVLPAAPHRRSHRLLAVPPLHVVGGSRRRDVTPWASSSSLVVEAESCWRCPRS